MGNSAIKRTGAWDLKQTVQSDLRGVVVGATGACGRILGNIYRYIYTVYSISCLSFVCL